MQRLRQLLVVAGDSLSPRQLPRRLLPLLLAAAKLGSGMSLVLVAASFIYLLFYYSLVGERIVERPLNFGFDSGCRLGGGAALPADEGVEAACSFPLANASLQPTPDHGGSLVFGQSYRVFVLLAMPDSEANRRAGMFMIRLAAYADGGRELRSSLRSALLPQRSALLRLLLALAQLPLSLLGSDCERRQLSVEMFEDFVENPFSASAGVTVQLQSRAVQLHAGSSVQFRAELSGLRFVMYHFPLLSAVFGICAFACLLLLLLTPLLLRRLLGAFAEAEEATWIDEFEEEPPKPAPRDETLAAGEEPQLRRRLLPHEQLQPDLDDQR